MNEEKYKEEFKDFLIGKGFYQQIEMWYEGKTTNSLKYFNDHFPRFRAMIELLEKNKKIEPLFIAEMGSFYPYTSFYFHPSCIDLYDIIGIRYLTFDKGTEITLHNYNVCTDELYFMKQCYDLVILSEVLEHLPCNLFEVEKKIMNIIEDDGYLIVTYPLGGKNAKDYDKIIGSPLKSYGEHLREFTEETVNLFFQSLTKVDESYVNYPAYGYTKIILYQKVKL